MQFAHAALRAKILMALAMTLAIGAAQAQTTQISFDDSTNGIGFLGSTPLGNQYQAQGLSFSSIGNGGNQSGKGGATVLLDGNPQNVSQGFGFKARSGSSFLAFNTNLGTGSQIQLNFATAVKTVSIWALANPNVQYFAPGGSKNMFVITAYDSSNKIVASSQAQTGANVPAGQAPLTSWQQLSVSGPSISRVVLNANGNNVNYSYGFSGGYDDLSFTAAVPEPESYALMLAGLGLLGLIGRRKKAA